MTIFDVVLAVLAGWPEGVSLGPQVISGFRAFSRAVNS